MQDNNETECFMHIPEVDRTLERPPKHETKRINEDMDTTDLQPALAFQKFAGSAFHPNEDYSDSIVNRRLTELSSQRSVFTSEDAPRSFESPMERYARMREELALFERDVKLMQKQELKREEDTELTTLLARQIKSLQSQLAQLEPSVSNLNPAALSAQGSSSQALLLRQLQQVAAQKSGQPAPTSIDNSTTDQTSDATDQKGSSSQRVTYELYMDATGGGGGAPSDAWGLEQRVAALEKNMGARKLTEGEDVEWPDVISGLTAMSAQIKAVDWRKLDSQSRTLRTLLDEFKALRNIRRSHTESKHQEKVSQLHSMMSRWDGAAVCLPTVIDRLSTLRTMHQENGAVLTRLARLEALASKIDSSVRADSQTLQQASESLVTNAAIMQKNVVALADRMDALTQKIAQLES